MTPPTIAMPTAPPAKPAAPPAPVKQAESLDGRTRRREQNAERLYDAADELLMTRPYEELTIEEICDHAGVGRATFFRIYETKAGLLREFNRRLASDAQFRLAAAGDVDVRDALDHIRKAVIDAWRHTGGGHIGMAADFIRSNPSTNLHAAHPELLALVTGRIATAISAGELTDAVPVELAASLALIHMTAPVAYAIAGHNVDLDGLSRTMLDQWYAGMVSPAGRPAPEPKRRRIDRVIDSGAPHDPSNTHSGAKKASPDRVIDSGAPHDPSNTHSGAKKASPDRVIDSGAPHDPSNTHSGAKKASPDRVIDSGAPHDPSNTHSGAKKASPDRVIDSGAPHDPSNTHSGAKKASPDRVFDSGAVQNRVRTENDTVTQSARGYISRRSCYYLRRRNPNPSGRSAMSTTVQDLDLGKYKLGWADDVDDYVFTPKRGLTKEIVQEMSWMKGEPEWMLKFRLRALDVFHKKPMPNWGGALDQIFFDDIYYYVKPMEGQVDSWDALPNPSARPTRSSVFRKRSRSTSPV